MRRNSVKPLLLAATFVALAVLLFTSTLVSSAEAPVIEWAPFVKGAGVSDEQLLAAADLLSAEFLAGQRGFIKRELIKKNAAEYADVIHWKSLADAEATGIKVGDCLVCREYFELMDMTPGGKTGAGFSHYQVIGRWGE